MPDLKISQLTSATTPLAGTEVLPIVQSSTTVKVAVSDLTAGRSVSASALTASSGNLTFSGTAQRITGDFSNATQSNRLAFQTSTTNGSTIVNAITNGAGVTSAFQANAGADISNPVSFTRILVNATESRVEAGITNVSGTYLPMTFYTGGFERVQIDTSGRVLVGASSSVNDTFGASLFQVSNTDGNLASYGRYSNDAFSPTIYLRKSRGSIGAQGVVSSGDALGAFLFTGSDGTGFIQGATIKAEVDGTPGTNDMPGRLVFSTTADGAASPTEHMRIDSSGNVGIGTLSPGGPLSIQRGDASTTIGGSSSVIKVNNANGTLSTTTGIEFFATANLTVNTGRMAGIYGVYSSFNAAGIGGALVFATNTPGDATIDERMRIDASGNVGIGTNSPGQKLDVVSTTATDTYIRNRNSVGIGDFILLASGDVFVTAQTAGKSLLFGTVGSERMRITAAGNIVAGASAALATTATDGFLYVPTCAGTPTGTPTAITGMAPIVVDTTNNKLYFYSGGTWRDAGP